MKISEFHKEYTDGSNYSFFDVAGEIKELLQEAFKFNKKSMLDEFSDVSVNFQLWLYTSFRLEQNLWKISFPTYKKLHKRKQIWNKIYKYAGLRENCINYFGNYERKEKVITQLRKLNVSKKKSKKAYEKIVLPILSHQKYSTN